MDVQTEIAQGKKYHEQVLQEYGVYADEKLQQYVREVGQRLAAQSHRSELSWTFTVLDSPEINAFAVPGGFVYITRGLMVYLNSEAELAGVLGHEIGHVTARHGSRQATRTQAAGIGVLAATLLGAYLGDRYGVANAGDIAQQVSSGYAQYRILGYSRDQELEADRLGAEYLHRIGLDPRRMTSVISVLKAQETFAQAQARALGRTLNETPNWLRTHPANDQRLAEMQKIADSYSGKYGDDGRNRYLQKLDGVTFGDSPSQGIARGRNFYHPPLGFRVSTPEGWHFQNTPSVLLAIRDDQTAAVALTGSFKSNGDHSAALRAVLQPDSGTVKATTVNGLRATEFEGAKQGKPIRATVITLRNVDYVLQTMRGQGATATAVNEAGTVVTSFRPMTAEEVRDVRPMTVRTVTAKSVSPFGELATATKRAAPHLRNPEAQLRLLNQAYPEGNVPVSSLVKTIQ